MVFPIYNTNISDPRDQCPYHSSQTFFPSHPPFISPLAFIWIWWGFFPTTYLAFDAAFLSFLSILQSALATLFHPTHNCYIHLGNHVLANMLTSTWSNRFVDERASTRCNGLTDELTSNWGNGLINTLNNIWHKHLYPCLKILHCPHSWGSIQVCCIFHPCGGYHYHWIEIVSCKWLGKPTTTCGRTTWTFCFLGLLGNDIGFCTFVLNGAPTFSTASTLATSWIDSKSSYVPDYTPTPIKTDTNLQKKG